MCEDQRPCVVHRLNDVVRTIDVRCTDDLYVGGGYGIHFRHEGGDVLINVWSENGLDHENVVPAFHCLHHAQIIDVSVAIEVKVGKHV